VDKHLCGGFAGSIRVTGRQDAAFEEIIVVILDFTVHFVRRNMDKALNARLFGAL